MAWFDPSNWGALFGDDDNPWSGAKPGGGKITGGQVLPGRFPKKQSEGNSDSGGVIVGDWFKPKPSGPPMRQQDPNINERPSNPLNDLYQKLASMFDNGMPGGGGNGGGMSYQPSYQAMPYEEMQRRAEMLAGSQYDPQIDAINRAIGETQGRAERSKTEIGNMYQALSAAYAADVPKVQGMYDQAQTEAVNRQKSLQDSLNQNYTDRQANVNAEAAALGQQDAAAHVNQGIGADQAFLSQLANTVSEQTNSNLGLLENANVAYTQQGGTLAGLEGNNRQADLMTQLEDYIRAQQGDIEGLQNSRQADYARYLTDIQTQDQQSMMQENQFAAQFQAQQSQQQAAQQQQQAALQWQQMMDLAGIKMKIAEQQNGGMSIADQIAASRLGMDQSQAGFGMNKDIMEMALKISEEQNISFEEAMKFVQASVFPQQG